MGIRASTSSFLAGRAAVLQRAAAASAAPSARWLQRGIPEVDAQTAGIFRVLFGLAVLHVLRGPRRSTPHGWRRHSTPRSKDPLHATVLRWLRERPAIVDWLGPWMLVTGIAFTAGLFTRMSYGLFVAAATRLGICGRFLRQHPSAQHADTDAGRAASIPLGRWGFDRPVAQRRAPPHRAQTARRGPRAEALASRRRCQQAIRLLGMAPGLVVGIAFAAAAWSKLTRPDGWTTWILNGTREVPLHHRLRERAGGLGPAAGRAPEWLAILASFGAVAIEALAITAAFSAANRTGLASGSRAQSRRRLPHLHGRAVAWVVDSASGLSAVAADLDSDGPAKAGPSNEGAYRGAGFSRLGAGSSLRHRSR